MRFQRNMVLYPMGTEQSIRKIVAGGRGVQQDSLSLGLVILRKLTL